MRLVAVPVDFRVVLVMHELDEEDRQIRQRSGHSKNPPWVQKVLGEARAERLAIMERLRKQAANGEAE